MQLNIYNNISDTSQGAFATEVVECYCIANDNDTPNSTNNVTTPVRNLQSSSDLITSLTIEISKECLDLTCASHDEVLSIVDDSKASIANEIVSAVSNVTDAER